MTSASRSPLPVAEKSPNGKRPQRLGIGRLWQSCAGVLRLQVVLAVVVITTLVLLYSPNSTMWSYAPTYAHLPIRANMLSAIFAGANDTQLEQLMVQTGIMNAPTAALLDLAVNKTTFDERRDLVRMQQAAYCRSGQHKNWAEHNISRVRFSNSSVFVHSGQDIVSDSIRSGNSWENTEIQQMLWALKVPLYGLDRSQFGRPPLMVDVGSNVGWFALNAAAAGARVAAFEGMADNIRLIRASLCYNDWLAQRMTLYATGVGEKDASCYIVSGHANRGNGNTVCTNDIEAELADMSSKQLAPGLEIMKYEARGEMTVRRIDTMLDEDVKILKIDIEGFEVQALKGAAGLFARHKIWFLMSECNQPVIGRDGAMKYLRFLYDQGYKISQYSFQGPFMAESEILAGEVPELVTHISNLYCVQKDWLEMHLGHANAQAPIEYVQPSLV